jgi:hypothetical protein
VTGTPTTKFDGILTVLGGTYPNGTMYSTFLTNYNQRIAVSSDLEISLSCTYDSVANSGTIDAEVTNTAVGPIDGILHFVIIESHIPYWWTGLDHLNNVARNMLPDANGETVTIPASDTILRSRNFTIEPAWNERKCEIVVFVQNSATREIYQGAQISIINEPSMQYYGMAITETSGNGNGFLEAGESAEIKASARNIWKGDYTGGATVQCADPYLTVTGYTSSTDTVSYGEIDTVVTFTIDIDPSCPDPRLTAFELDFGPTIDTIPMVITSNPGFSDDIESGQGGWTHSGPGDNWHITEYKSYSPTHSWYCGIEGSWVYTNNNNSYLTSPYFTVAPACSLDFRHQYRLENNYDFGYFEIDNGSGWWNKRGTFNGVLSSWTQAVYPLTAYAGQTIRIRFRLASDASVTQEGWYIDDVYVPMLKINETNTGAEITTISLQVHPNPFSNLTNVNFNIGQGAEHVELNIYDATGRLVRNLYDAVHHAPCTMQFVWDGTDQHNRKVGSGVYFITLQSSNTKLVEKAILLK